MYTIGKPTLIWSLLEDSSSANASLVVDCSVILVLLLIITNPLESYSLRTLETLRLLLQCVLFLSYKIIV